MAICFSGHLRSFATSPERRLSVLGATWTPRVGSLSFKLDWYKQPKMVALVRPANNYRKTNYHPSTNKKGMAHHQYPLGSRVSPRAWLGGAEGLVLSQESAIAKAQHNLVLPRALASYLRSGGSTISAVILYRTGMGAPFGSGAAPHVKRRRWEPTHKLLKQALQWTLPRSLICI